MQAITEYTDYNRIYGLYITEYTDYNRIYGLYITEYTDYNRIYGLQQNIRTITEYSKIYRLQNYCRLYGLDRLYTSDYTDSTLRLCCPDAPPPLLMPPSRPCSNISIITVHSVITLEDRRTSED